MSPDTSTLNSASRPPPLPPPHFSSATAGARTQENMSSQAAPTTLDDGWGQLKEHAIDVLESELETGFTKGLSKPEYIKVYT